MSNESLNIDRYLNNGTNIPSIILGSFQVKNLQIMLDMIETAISAGGFGFDTSPSYGTERILSIALHKVTRKEGILRNQLFIADKIDGWQMFKGNGDVENYVDQSLQVMELDYFDLLLVHWPFEKYLYNTWKCFERMYKRGKIKSIGICNINSRILDKLVADGITVLPHVIQNEISPIRTCVEEITYFQNMGITVEAYSPLCRMIEPIKESETLRNIAEKNNRSIAQVILRWHIQRGIIPIFTSTKPERVKSNFDVFDFELTDSDIKKINALNQDYKIFPESYGCPGY
jgi:diketogulonate reductase-like aldo/keto reductase